MNEPLPTVRITLADAFVRTDPPPKGPFTIKADRYSLVITDAGGSTPLVMIGELRNAAELAEALAKAFAL